MKTSIQTVILLLAAVVLMACSSGSPRGSESVGETQEALKIVCVIFSDSAFSQNTIAVGEQSQYVTGQQGVGRSTCPETASSWSVSNTAVASISATGLVTALKVGTTTVTAHFATAPPEAVTLTVVAGPVSMAIRPATSTIPVGFFGIELLIAEDLYSKSSPEPDLTCTWTSSNPKVATVDIAGIVEGVAPGTVTITATDCLTLDTALSPAIFTDAALSGTATVTVTGPTVVDAGADSGKPDSGTDSGKPDAQVDATTDASVDSGEDAVADTGVEAEAEAGEPVCSSINLTSAPIVNSTSVQGTPPAMTGGPIIPGQYVLQQIALYFPVGSGEGGSTPPTSQIVQVSGTSILSDLLEYADPANGYPAEPDAGDIFGEFVVDWDYTLSAPSTMNYTYVCGASGTGTNGYTASPTSLVLSYTLQTGTEVYTYALSAASDL